MPRPEPGSTGLKQGPLQLPGVANGMQVQGLVMDVGTAVPGYEQALTLLQHRDLALTSSCLSNAKHDDVNQNFSWAWFCGNPQQHLTESEGDSQAAIDFR